MELAWFVQNTFALNEPEAEVVAIKLQRTFDQYNLSAHPSYFAGIPKQILFKLLEASGRAELIALAVEGILLLLVSEDQAKVRISKSRREDFLSMLVVRLHVHKEGFSQEGVVSLAKDNAHKYAYEIDALSFVNDFIDTGILSFVGDKVVFSLPYLERYLLAKKLSEDEALALAYFDMNDDKFDFPTFDLYCEIGPSKRLTDLVCAMVADTGDAHPLQDGHFLLGKKLQPQLLTDKGRFGRIQQRLKRLSDDVQTGKGNRSEKQAMLDAVGSVRRKTREKSAAVVERIVFPDDGSFTTLTRVAHVLSVGVAVLGAGAESIEADEKQGLAYNLVKLASILIDLWTREYAKIDFDSIKAAVINDEGLINKFRDNGKEVPPALIHEVKLVFSGVFDIAEFALLASPLHATFGFICERARSSILALSLERANVLLHSGGDKTRKAGPIEHLLIASWLSDIDSKRGREVLLESIRRSPQDMFLRVALAGHLMERVFWDHWLIEDRKILLDAAEESLKPFMALKSKPEIMRSIGLSISDTERAQRRERRRRSKQHRRRG